MGILQEVAKSSRVSAKKSFLAYGEAVITVLMGNFFRLKCGCGNLPNIIIINNYL
jgi:hypothetical protein